MQEAINGRLARLGKPARGVAEAVAVISPSVSLPLLTAVMPQVDAGLEQCLTAGVLHIETRCGRVPPRTRTQQAIERRRELGDRLREGDNLRWLSYLL